MPPRWGPRNRSLPKALPSPVLRMHTCLRTCKAWWIFRNVKLPVNQTFKARSSKHKPPKPVLLAAAAMPFSVQSVSATLVNKWATSKRKVPKPHIHRRSSSSMQNNKPVWQHSRQTSRQGSLLAHKTSMHSNRQKCKTLPTNCKRDWLTSKQGSLLTRKICLHSNRLMCRMLPINCKQVE